MRRAAAMLGLLLVGCSSPRANAPAAFDDSLPDTCSPLRSAGACMMPWPNAIYLDRDPATRTGYRLALTKETLPVVAGTGTELDHKRWNDADGFSPATPILVYFPEHLDPASLVSWRNESPSGSAESATVLVDMQNNARVLHMSELDANIHREQDRQALLMRPSARL